MDPPSSAQSAREPRALPRPPDQERSPRRPRPRRHLLREYLEALLIAVVFAVFARAFVLQAFKIPSGSMETNLLVGDHVLVNKFVYGAAGTLGRKLLPARALRRGDVVVFKFPLDPARDFVKRCVGLPGDTVEIIDKALRVNGQPVDERTYVHHADPNVYPRSPLLAESARLRDNFGPYTVPAGHYFCLGDNRDSSDDSRFWGPVPASYVKGRAFMIYWSFPGRAEADPGSDTGGPLTRLTNVLARLSAGTRWERSFRLVR